MDNRESKKSTRTRLVKKFMGIKLLSQNSELKPDGIFNWSIPAFAIKLSNGQNFNACPTAGACAEFCYARNGTYLFRNVRQRHIWNLELTLYQSDFFKASMIEECSKPKMVGKFVRIHDAGDFYSEKYLFDWIEIIKACPDVTFYAYTKEVSMFKKYIENNCPTNFKYLYSLGGKEDHLIDLQNDRHAEVFPDDVAILEAGYKNQDASDLLAITLPTNKIGIPANNIKHFNKKMAKRTFGQLQNERDFKRQTKLEKAI
jgi:hypothetical protein